MPADVSWKATYREVEVVLRQTGARDFQVRVGDGTLTHFHPLRGCDFNTARLRAYDFAVQFSRLREDTERTPASDLVILEWEAVQGSG